MPPSACPGEHDGCANRRHVDGVRARGDRSTAPGAARGLRGAPPYVLDLRIPGAASADGRRNGMARKRATAARSDLGAHLPPRRPAPQRKQKASPSFKREACSAAVHRAALIRALTTPPHCGQALTGASLRR
jgi:hypothetical protein